MLNPITETLINRIQSEGPVSLQEIMALSNAFYYKNSIIFGEKGDFITAPEICQIFGEMIGLWAILQAQRLKTQTPIIIELGPGRGTLMADMIRIFKQQKNFTPCLHLVETSPPLEEIQKHTLKGSPYPLTWHNKCPTSSLSKHAPVLIIANEFFDALPFQQYLYAKNKWHEVFVTYEKGHFVYTRQACKNLHFFPPSANEGDCFEYSAPSIAYAKTLSSLLRQHTGAALLIDYGDVIPHKRTGNTFQALRHHTYVPPLSFLGQADLTYHVDFARLYHLFKEDGHACQLSSQRQFLKSYGFDLRLTQLLASFTTETQKKDFLERASRLIHPKAMGTLFKVLEIR